MYDNQSHLNFIHSHKIKTTRTIPSHIGHGGLVLKGTWQDVVRAAVSR